MIRFYFHPTPNPAKVALFLEEAGLPYETVPVDTSKGEQHLPAFRKINPNGKVPAIVDTEGPGGHCQLEDAVGALVTGLGKLGVGTDAEYVEPDAERIGACVTIVTGGQEVTAKLEVVVDPTVGGQKSLRMRGRLEALH